MDFAEKMYLEDLIYTESTWEQKETFQTLTRPQRVRFMEVLKEYRDEKLIGENGELLERNEDNRRVALGIAFKIAGELQE